MRRAVLSLALSGTKIEREHARLVEALEGARPDPSTFDASAYDAATLSQARTFWRARLEAEHRSVSVFLLLGAQLIEANATLDAKTIMLRLAQDELRHTELCGLVLRAMGEEPRVEVDLNVAPLATHAGCSVEERALRNVIYACCLSEMIAVGRLVDALETTTDPFVREVTRSIVADEVMHGQFGFLYLEACRAYLETRPDVRASLEEYCRHAFAVLERELVHERLRGVAKPLPGAVALGVIDPDRAREVFYGTIEAAIVPGLEQHGIEASHAFRERRLA